MCSTPKSSPRSQRQRKGTGGYSPVFTAGCGAIYAARERSGQWRTPDATATAPKPIQAARPLSPWQRLCRALRVRIG